MRRAGCGVMIARMAIPSLRRFAGATLIAASTAVILLEPGLQHPQPTDLLRHATNAMHLFV